MIDCVECYRALCEMKFTKTWSYGEAQICFTSVTYLIRGINHFSISSFLQSKMPHVRKPRRSVGVAFDLLETLRIGPRQLEQAHIQQWTMAVSEQLL